MTSLQDTKGELRAAFVQRELTNARNSLSNGVPGLIVRAALVTLFVNLLFVAYALMGAIGLVFVSLMFLLALSTPLFVQMAKRLRVGPKEGMQPVNRAMEPGVQSEG